MAAREPFSLTDIQLWLQTVLAPDPLMQQYAAGGIWAEHPPEGTTFHVVRHWIQTPGKDVAAQDGQSGRIVSTPKIIVCMLDKQPGGRVDYYDGTGSPNVGDGYLYNGQKRLYALLHNRFELVNGIQWYSRTISAYQMTEPLEQGGYDVMCGYWFDLTAA
jgi:hypothetical protein